jgi:hypothetical protein
MFNNFFLKNLTILWDDVEKYGTARQAADDNMAHVYCVLHKAKESFRIQYIFCFSMATGVT